MDQVSKMLWDASASGDFSKVCSAFAQGASVDTESADSRSALMRSSKRGFEDIVRFLLDNGADVRARDINNKTALMGACKKGHLNIARMLVHAGSDVNSHDDNGRTALMRAAFLGR